MRSLIEKRFRPVAHFRFFLASEVGILISMLTSGPSFLGPGGRGPMTTSGPIEKGHGSGHVSNAYWLFRGMVVGRECCRNPNALCCQICKLMWKIWIVILAGFLFISTLTNLGFVFWRFQPLELHPDFFLAAKMKRMLILGPGLVPFTYVILNFCALFVSLCIMTTVFVRCPFMFLLCGMFGCVQNLLSLGTILLLVLEVVYGWGEWPDDPYVTSLERLLTLELRKQDTVDGAVSIAWTNTQQLFGCCGVHSYQDWFNGSKNFNQSHVGHVSGLRVLPFSCCKGDTEADFCYEALSASWNERGCLEPQISELKYDWFFLTISTALLFLSLSALRRAVTIFRIKFPTDSGNAAGALEQKNQLMGAATISSSWEKHPPPPRKNRKPHDSEDEERKPLLLESWSEPILETGRRSEQGPATPRPSTTFLFKSPGIESRSNPELMSAVQSGEFGHRLMSSGSRPLHPPYEAPPQIYFPSRTPSREDGESGGQQKSNVAETRSGPVTIKSSNHGSKSKELVPAEGSQVKETHFDTPEVASTPMLLRD